MERPRRISKAWLVLAALGIGIAVVALTDILFTLLTDRPLAFAADVQPITAFVVAIPFLVLALVGARRLLPWLVGLALTLCFWGYLLFEGVSYQWNSDGSGANIGLGLIMMFIAPPFISGMCVLAYNLRKRPRE